MAVNVEIENKENENNANVLRKFSRGVRSSGVLKKVRKLRYSSRPSSKFLKKKQALHKMKKTEEFERLFKLGKVSDQKNTRRR